MADPQDLAAAQLRRLVNEVAAEGGISPMAAVALVGEELVRTEQKVVADARREGATWRQVADELRLASRQTAQSKFSEDRAAVALPGMSAAAMARRLGNVHHQTVAAHPERHGIIVRTYPGAAGKPPRKRYFLPGDPGLEAAPET